MSGISGCDGLTHDHPAANASARTVRGGRSLAAAPRLGGWTTISADNICLSMARLRGIVDSGTLVPTTTACLGFLRRQHRPRPPPRDAPTARALLTRARPSVPETERESELSSDVYGYVRMPAIVPLRQHGPEEKRREHHGESARKGRLPARRQVQDHQGP
jgi:hypothetical protein